MTMRSALVGLVSLQLVLMAITWWPSGEGGAPVPLLALDRDAITTIEIAAKPEGDAAPNPVVLARGPNGWVVRSAADYPARADEIEELLGQLLDLEARDPVATRAASHNTLNVGDEGYGRRIVVTAGGEPITLVLGAATSKSVNVRLEGSDDVYRADGVSEWSFSDMATNYYDPVYVSGVPSEFSEVRVVNGNGEFSFEKQGEGFTLTGLLEGEEVDAAAIDQFLRAVTNVRLNRPVGQQIETAYALGDLDAGGARIDWTVSAVDQSIAGGYAVGAGIESDRYVKATNSPFVVRVPESATARLRDAHRAEFLLGPD